MNNSGKLSGKTVFITGGSRGIGKQIALKVARDGANVVVAAKTTKPHPKLPGSIYTAVKEIEEAGGQSLACAVDIRYEDQVIAAVEAAVKKFGGIDILINNASALSLASTENTDMKKYDLMHNINTRGTFLVSKACIPYLKKSSHAHILNMSPPLNINPKFFGSHVAYSIAKTGMSLCVLGMHQELKPFNIAVNALWPKAAIHTEALDLLVGPEKSKRVGRKPEIVADAAYYILTQEPKPTGNFFIDEDVLKSAGIINMDQYLYDPKYKNELHHDFFEYITEGSNKSLLTSEESRVNDVFKSFEKHLNIDVINVFKCIFQFRLSGKVVGNWYLDLKTAPGSWGMGDSPKTPDTVISMFTEDFLNLFSGKAFSSINRNLTIDGDVMSAIKLEKFLSSIKTKL